MPSRIARGLKARNNKARAAGPGFDRAKHRGLYGRKNRPNHHSCGLSARDLPQSDNPGLRPGLCCLGLSGPL